MIGWMPDAAIFSENSSAPNMLSVSVSASAGCLSALASSASLPIGQRAFQQRIGGMHVQMHEAWIGRHAGASGFDRGADAVRDSVTDTKSLSP